MRIGYVNYGSQSGVTGSLLRELRSAGHALDLVDPTDVLELRSAQRRLPRPTPRVLLHLVAAAAQHGRLALDHRWNTPYAWDVHSARAGQLIDALPLRPDVLLQNGALFAPGAPPGTPYVLLCDNTCALAARNPPVPEAGIGAHVEFGKAWGERETALYRGAAGIATFSERVRRSLIDDYGVLPGAVTVVGAGANVTPAGERAHDGRTLLFVGKGSFRQKGGPVLLAAFRRLRKVRPEARLLLVGPTEPLELPEGAESLGLVPFERVATLLQQATAFVLPTLREPFGIAFLDAMICGVPCIGTEDCAIPEILDHGRAGILVPVGDDAALAEAMRGLLDDPLRAEALGAAGRRLVLEKGLLWPVVARRVEEMLLKAASRARAA